MDEFIEQKIITGLIVSTDFNQRIRRFWSADLLQSPELRRIAIWVGDYFLRYGEAPDRDIETIYMEHLQQDQIPKADAEFIEQILNTIADEYGRGTLFNSAYLYDKTVQYLRQRELRQHSELVQDLIDQGKTTEANELAQSFTPSITEVGKGLELGSDEAVDRIQRAFSESIHSVLSFPGALGDMMNEHLVRGGFAAFLSPEKRGKSWILLELAMRGIRQRANVAFFQAGDMTEDQQLRRIGMYLARKSDREKYCKGHWSPVGDCVWNQIDSCERSDRNCDHGILQGVDCNDYISKKNILESLDNLSSLAPKFPDYSPCDSYLCKERWGTPWIRWIESVSPLKGKEAAEKLSEFFRRYRRRFKLATYTNSTLTVGEIRSCLNEWEIEDGFVPDIIVIDYADLLHDHTREFRHRQDAIWKGLRGISQEKHCLLITATQSDSASYKTNRLSLSNFSEDKRKYAHVTVMWGLNQDTGGREKQLGILRINELVVREGEFNSTQDVKVLQDLKAARPFLESYK
ncbi:MAG: hypothetical protein GWN01_09410 [Nitrosopumilaceae archaeon]|nr:hypothetical protein [Nitrosopumilaceae archaeon]NIU87826.1 hypothetical protein [Nitrosopumilaceae archaeon]NIV65208.1 hypothetical protein [Nitrosopumilaceae archaeon]NIX61724.1 hypothetical protein [Nitrosopumilaceae archaeon]